MNKARINNEIELTYPDGFREMSEDELSKYFSSPANRWGAYNADEHIILSVSWTKKGFLSFLTDEESILIGAESCMKRNLLNYQRISSFKTTVASKKARGIRFEYRVNDAKIIQVGDLIVFRQKNKFYAVHYITRKANAGSSRVAFEETLKSISVG